MPTKLPIACSLSATELPARLAEMSDLGRAALLDVERSGARAVLRFRSGAEIRQRLAVIVAAEARCCALLDMRLRDDDGGLALTVDAPANAAPVVDELVAAFAAAPRAAS
jgi:hypothetical protein